MEALVFPLHHHLIIIIIIIIIIIYSIHIRDKHLSPVPFSYRRLHTSSQIHPSIS